MRARTAGIAAVLTLLALVTAGCPSGGHFGRYILINGNDDAIEALTITTPNNTKTWETTEPGQAWVIQAFGTYDITVSWKTKAGETHEVQFSIEDKAGYRCKKDLMVDVRDKGIEWKLVDQHGFTEI